MEIGKIRQKAMMASAEYVRAIKEIEERGTRKLSYQDGFIDGAIFIQTWISPLEQKPEDAKTILFKLKNNEKRFGYFLRKDQFERDNMFCDGAFFSMDEVIGWMYAPD